MKSSGPSTDLTILHNETIIYLQTVCSSLRGSEEAAKVEKADWLENYKDGLIGWGVDSRAHFRSLDHLKDVIGEDVEGLLFGIRNEVIENYGEGVEYVGPRAAFEVEEGTRIDKQDEFYHGRTFTQVESFGISQGEESGKAEETASEGKPPQYTTRELLELALVDLRKHTQSHSHGLG